MCCCALRPNPSLKRTDAPKRTKPSNYPRTSPKLPRRVKQFPSVTRELAVGVLEKARVSLVADAHLA